MRFNRLGLSFAAALTLALMPAGAHAQVIIRDPCFDRGDSCWRRDDFDRIQRDRALDRAARAEERARRLDDARMEREINAQFRAEARAEARATTLRRSELRAQEREDRAMERRDQIERNRELRLRTTRVRWRSVE